MKRFLTLACLAVVALVVASCGGDDDSGDGGGQAGQAPASISVGVLPIVDVAPLYLAIEQGYFEEEGLVVEPEVGVGGAAVVPAVVGGDVDIGFSGYTSLVAAQQQGLDLTVVSDGVAAPEDPEQDVTAVVVSGDSGIEQPIGLEGKRMGVNALKGVVELSTRVAADEAGVDTSSLRFVEVPIPEQRAALDAGEIDAALLPDPFLTGALSEGDRQVLPAFAAVSPGLGYAGYFTSAEAFSERTEVFEGFRAAMSRALEYARENPDAVREILPTYTELGPDLARQIRMPQWPDNSDETLDEAISIWAETMVDYEFVEESVDPDALLPRG